jgi:hypothetical protein
MAEVTSFTVSSLGERSCTSLVTLSGGANDTINNAKLVAAASSGALNTFLTATYANAAAVKAAFDSQFGVVILRPETGAGVAGLAWVWTATASTPSVTLVNAGAAGTFEATMLLLHSTIQ